MTLKLYLSQSLKMVWGHNDCSQPNKSASLPKSGALHKTEAFLGVVTWTLVFQLPVFALVVCMKYIPSYILWNFPLFAHVCTMTLVLLHFKRIIHTFTKKVLWGSYKQDWIILKKCVMWNIIVWYYDSKYDKSTFFFFVLTFSLLTKSNMGIKSSKNCDQIY